MVSISTQCLNQLISPNVAKIFIGYSGGLDSQVLLHLCASVPTISHKTTAVYIHHGLQKVADDWEIFCTRQANQLGVKFQCIRVDATPQTGESPESAARNARYAAFKSLINMDDVLLLAQHREDQMETLLLQLFRGAGLQGLASMPVQAQFGKGEILRPFLDIAKEDIKFYAQHHALDWVEDPSNQESNYDRNFLRNQIIPLLKQRWPALDKTVSRAAVHCANASNFIDDWVKQNLPALLSPNDSSLNMSKLALYDAEQRHWLLRGWLRMFGLRPPSEAVLKAVVDQVINAKVDAIPKVHVQGHWVTKFRTHLYCLNQLAMVCDFDPLVWQSGNNTLTIGNGYMLTCSPASVGISQEIWDNGTVVVKPRCGGERLKLPNRAGHHPLKKLYQEFAVPPWERELRPLVYINDRLAAVAGLWVDEWAWSTKQGACYDLAWQCPSVNV